MTDHQGPVPNLRAMVEVLRSRVEEHAAQTWTTWPPPPPSLQWVGPPTQAMVEADLIEVGLASLRKYHPTLYAEVVDEIVSEATTLDDNASDTTTLAVIVDEAQDMDDVLGRAVRAVRRWAPGF